MCDRLGDGGLVSGDNQHAIPMAILHPLPCSAHSKLTRAPSVSLSRSRSRSGRHIHQRGSLLDPQHRAWWLTPPRASQTIMWSKQMDPPNPGHDGTQRRCKEGREGEKGRQEGLCCCVRPTEWTPRGPTLWPLALGIHPQSLAKEKVC